MKLYVFPPSPRAMKVIALAEHLQLEHEVRLVDLTKGDQMKPEFTALNPNQRMPVLEDDGFVLWESNAILQYLAVLGGLALGSGLRNSRLRAAGQETAGAGRCRPGRHR
jgi:glutathione S-transferase